MRDDKGPISQPRILSHGRNIEEEDGLAYTREIKGAVGETGGNIGDCGRRDHVFLAFVPEVYLHLGVKISRVNRIRREETHILGEAVAMGCLSEDLGIGDIEAVHREIAFPEPFHLSRGNHGHADYLTADHAIIGKKVIVLCACHLFLGPSFDDGLEVLKHERPRAASHARAGQPGPERHRCHLSRSSRA